MAAKHKECRRLRGEGVFARAQAEVEARLAGRGEPLRPCLDFRRALAGTGGDRARWPRVIAEVKRASPSAGSIRPDAEPASVARTYEEAGAAAVSVLTDRVYFQGSPEDLAAVRSAVRLPVLRKDFIVDEGQLFEARLLGADSVLLIATVLDRRELARLLGLARDLGLGALVEVHDEAELERAVAVGADVVGVNNRDLRTFVTDLATAERLGPLVPRDLVWVAESGLRTRADVARMADAGAHAVLVGEALMRAADAGALLRSLAAPPGRGSATEGEEGG
ncbi:MAG: indole-3-glycerol phosphate synthase TrpC, partial [Clostridia bacterium]|nr:indole-3-glycerol phosphate synthase TrpC [Clostridia bacterium]